MSGMQRNIAVIGANGFVGSQICRAIDLIPKYSLIKILRESNLSDGIKQADVIIHAANPAGRFRTESNPEQDFSATVDKTYEILSHCGDKKLVLISSLSCRTQMNINYGRNRRMCELLALAAHGTVVRLGPMFGIGRTRDTLHDILEGRQVFVSATTRYGYVNVEWAGSEIVRLLGSPSDLYEVGARDSISLAEIAEYFGSISKFSGLDDSQFLEGNDIGPSARKVIRYASEELENQYWKSEK